MSNPITKPNWELDLHDDPTITENNFYMAAKRIDDLIDLVNAQQLKIEALEAFVARVSGPITSFKELITEDDHE